MLNVFEFYPKNALVQKLCFKNLNFQAVLSCAITINPAGEYGFIGRRD